MIMKVVSEVPRLPRALLILIAGAGLHAMVERPFDDAFFELGHDGVRTDIAFDDLEDRSVRLMIRETDTRPRPAPPMARGLFRAVSMFRDWPATYVWRGTIQLPATDARAERPLALVSGWERIAQ